MTDRNEIQGWTSQHWGCGEYYEENPKAYFLETTRTKVRVSNVWSCFLVLLPARGRMDSRTPRASPHPLPHFIVEGRHLALTLQLERMPSPPAQIILVFTELPHQSGLEHVA